VVVVMRATIKRTPATHRPNITCDPECDHFIQRDLRGAMSAYRCQMVRPLLPNRFQNDDAQAFHCEVACIPYACHNSSPPKMHSRVCMRVPAHDSNGFGTPGYENSFVAPQSPNSVQLVCQTSPLAIESSQHLRGCACSQ
jgi:hypothetical protein